MKSNLYTRTGDAGTTSLIDGSRAPKHSIRIDAYGDIDELSSCLGLLATSKECPDEIKEEVMEVQHILFEVGAYLATPSSPVEDTENTGNGDAPCPVKGLEEETAKLEGWIDALDERTPKLRSFILPGGSEAASRCHLARTVCRRAERKISALAETNFVDPVVIGYVNRLSDYLFIAARYLNFLAGIEDVAWKRR